MRRRSPEVSTGANTPLALSGIAASSASKTGNTAPATCGGCASAASPAAASPSSSPSSSASIPLPLPISPEPAHLLAHARIRLTQAFASLPCTAPCRSRASCAAAAAMLPCCPPASLPDGSAPALASSSSWMAQPTPLLGPAASSAVPLQLAAARARQAPSQRSRARSTLSMAARRLLLPASWTRTPKTPLVTQTLDRTSPCTHLGCTRLLNQDPCPWNDHQKCL